MNLRERLPYFWILSLVCVVLLVAMWAYSGSFLPAFGSALLMERVTILAMYLPLVLMPTITVLLTVYEIFLSTASAADEE